MKRIPTWRRYARLLGANPRQDNEDELSFHYEMRVRDYMKSGLDESAARAAVDARMGDVQTFRAEMDTLGDSGLRETRRRELLGELRQDLSYGVRLLRRAPMFALVAVLTLSLGIGATTAIFSVVHRVLLAPLPYSEPDRLVRIWEVDPRGDDHNVVSSGNFTEWSTRSRSFSALGALSGPYEQALTGSGDPLQITVADVTPTVMQALATPPLLGRTFQPADYNGARDLAVLSHKLWQQRFGGQRSIVGQRIVLDGRPITVIGVMPADFMFPNTATELWLPLTVNDIDPAERRSHNLAVTGRLRPGVTVDQAQTELSAIAGALANEYPEFMKGWGVNVVPMHADLTAESRPLLIVLLATVAIVLLIACGNLANLLLARAVAREREMAVRGALGAGKTRIARQLLTESLIIALLGGALGVLLARGALTVLIARAPQNIPLLEQVGLNWSVLGFALAITLGSTLLFGLAPALRLAGADLQSALRARRGGGTLRDTRVRGGLLIAEVMLSVVLLVGAGLLVRSFLELQQVDLGYQTRGLVAMTVDIPRSRYAETPAQIAFYERLVERLAAIPGVSAAAWANHGPASGQGTTMSFRIENRQAANPSGREDPEELHVVSTNYFRTLGVPITAGRAFDSRDHANAPAVIIISHALARKHWPAGDAVGRRITWGREDSPWMEIVGIAADTRMASPDEEPLPLIYTPLAQKTWGWMSWGTLVARTDPRTDSKVLRGQFEGALWELDNQIPPQSFESVIDRYGHSIARRTFAMTLVLAFAVVALVLSLVGVYGLMAFMVAEQKQEIGVRMALGARSGDVLRDVLSRSLKLTLAGLVLGLGIATLATRYLATLLYQVQPNDPVTLGLIALLITGTTLLATWLPARRAVSISPLTALRG